MRGGEADHTLILLDGMELNSPTGGYDFAHLLVSEISRVEIIPGPQSVAHGGAGLAGTISLSTSDAAPISADSPAIQSASAAAEGGSFGSVLIRAAAALKNHKSRARLAAAFYASDNVDISPNDGREERDGYQNLTLHALYAHKMGGVLFQAAARHTQAKGDYDGTANGIPNDRLGGDSEYELRSTALRAQLRRDNHALAVSYLHRRDKNQDGMIRDITLNKIARATITAQSSWRMRRGDLSLRAGWELEEFQQTHNQNRREQTTRSFIAAEQSLAFRNALFTTFGLRYDRNSDFASSLTWRATAAWQIPVFMPLRLRAAYGTAVQNPSLYDLYGFNPSRFAFMPNPNLQPEKARGFEIGADLLPSPFSAIGVSYFETRLEKEITFNPQRGGPTIANATGGSERRGVEASLSWNMLSSLALQARYSFTSSKQPNGAQELRRPRHQIQASATWSPLRRLRLHVGAAYVSKQRDRVFLSEPPFARDVVLDGYALLHAKIACAFGAKTVVYLRAENLLDESYQHVAGYATRGIGVFAGVERRF